MKNEYYGLLKYFNEEDIRYFQNRFDEESAAEMIQSTNMLLNKAIQFQKDGVQPESEEGQEFAKEFWDKMLECTGGDVSQIVKISELFESLDGDKDEWKKKQDLANKFIESALEKYFMQHGVNPFEGVEL
jgi:hypothetical protein